MFASRTLVKMGNVYVKPSKMKQSEGLKELREEHGAPIFLHAALYGVGNKQLEGKLTHTLLSDMPASAYSWQDCGI